MNNKEDSQSPAELCTPLEPYDQQQNSDQSHHGCPKVKRRKNHIEQVLVSIKQLEPTDQLELWRDMINTHPFDLQQLVSLRAAIDDRSKVDFISNVPYEIALYIVSFLSPQDLCNAAQTCRSWRSVCEDNRIWREICKEDGLFDDEQALEALFKQRIARVHSKHIDIANQFASQVPKSEWKGAYLKHVNILRNWRHRKFGIKQAIAMPPTTQFQEHQIQQSKEKLDDYQYTMQLRCHEDHVITCLQYNSHSNLIVSGSDDQTLKVWCGETGRCLATLEGHMGGVWSSQLSEDDIVISGATDRTLRIWRARRGELMHTLYGHTSTVRCLALDGGKVVSGSRDTTLRLWDVQEGTCLQVFTGHSKAVRCVEYKDDTIVSGSYDNIVMVWDAVKGTCCHALECHIGRIYSLQFDGKIIASGSVDTTICIWDVDTGSLLHQLEGHQSLTSKMQLRGDLLVSANADSYCKVWNVKEGKCLHTLSGHASAITSVYFNSRHVVTSSDDGTVKLWDTKTGEFIRDLVVLPSASSGGVVWRIKASYSKLICAAGSRVDTAETHLLVLNFD